MLRVTQEVERAVSVQLSDKAEGCCALCCPGQPHCLQSDGGPTPAVPWLRVARLGASLLGLTFHLDEDNELQASGDPRAA